MTRLTLLSPPSRWGVIRRTIGLWLVVFLALGPTASAATYYVNVATGDDTRNATTAQNPATPWKTLTRALAGATYTPNSSDPSIIDPNPELASGDIIQVAAGTYAKIPGCTDPLGCEQFPLPLVDGVTVTGPVATPPTAIVQGDGSSVIISNKATLLSNTTAVDYLSFSNDGISFATNIAQFEPVSSAMSPKFTHNQFIATRPNSSAIKVENFGAAPAGGFNGTVDSNEFDGFDKAIYLYDSGFSGPLSTMSPTITNNTFTGNNYGVYVYMSEIYMPGGGSATYSPTISNNSFTGGSYGVFVSASISTLAGGATVDVSPSITGNTFSGQATNNVNILLRRVRAAANGTFTFAPQILTNPTMTGSSASAISISAHANVSLSGTASLSPSINGNSIGGGSDNIHLFELISTNGGNSTMSPLINSNTMGGATSDGILEVLSANVSGSATLTSAPSISNNTVSSAGNVGIQQSIDFKPGATATVTFNPLISSNTVTGTSFSGISLSWTLGGTFTPATLPPGTSAVRIGPNAAGTSLVSNASITGNQITAPGGGWTGLWLGYEISGFANVTTNWNVSTNTVQNSTGFGISVGSSRLTGALAGNVNLTLDGNNVTNSANNGITVNLVEATTGPIAQTILLTNNTSTGNAGKGLSLSITGSNNLTTNDVRVTGNPSLSSNAVGLFVRAEGWKPGGVPANPVLVSCNTITNNTTYGVQLSNVSSGPPADFGGGTNGSGTPSVGANQIFGNTTFDFFNGTPVAAGTVMAQKNWWGTTNTASIDAKIYDLNDDATKGLVDYSAFKLGPPTACGNSAPVANGDSYSTPEDTPLNVAPPGVLANDTDVDGDTLSAVLVSGPLHGLLTLNANGSFTYTPAANYNGPDAFTYNASDGLTTSASPATVSITVTPVNDAPVAANDTYSTNEDTPLNVAAPGVLANDTDVDADPLSAVLVSGPAHGTLTLNANGSFTYTPAANYNGPDSFTYNASDGSLSSNTATVSLTVVPVNDPPVAANDSYTTPEDTPLNVAAPGVLANDTDVDGDPLTASPLSAPLHGTLTLNANGSFTYTPVANYNGPDSFTYNASDGSLTSTATVSITVTPVNDPPVATNDAYSVNENSTLTVAAPGVQTNDTDVDGDPLTSGVVIGPAHGTLTLNVNGSFTYTPTANYFGPDSFTYKDSDGTAFSAPATVNITVVSVNQPPVAVNDSASTNTGSATVNVLANDSDPDGDPLTITSFTQGGHGTVSCTTPNCTYTAAPNFSGPDSFTYTISDGKGGTATATVSINVIAQNADLSVSVTATPEPVPVGSTITYTVTITNNGPSDASGLALLNTLPIGVTYVSNSGMPCTHSGDIQTCTAPSLSVGASISVTITATAPSSSGTITDVAQITASSNDPNNSNDVGLAVSHVIVPGPTCPSSPATPIQPVNGAVNVPNPVNFSWTAVAGATGYTVYGSIDGKPVQSFGNSAGAATNLAVTLTGTNIVWFVRALFDTNCNPIDSPTVGFVLEAPDTCESHVAPTLLSPANNTTGSSALTFQWNPVLHTDGYRVWVSIDSAPFAALNEKTQATSFSAIIPFGRVEWYVEALFAGCPSTQSAHSIVTIPPAASCAGNTAPTLLGPANGTTVHNQSIDFSWSAVPNALGYELYISLNSGTPALLGTTRTQTTLHHDVAAGSLEWFVRALFAGCPGVDSQHATFTFDPPPACPTERPITIAPADGSTGLNSPVTFQWSGIPGITQYVLSYTLNHGTPVTLTTTNNHIDNVAIGAGAIEWSVEADSPNCPSLNSTLATFTIVPPPPPCLTPDAPELRAPANASSNVAYTVRWNPVPDASFYEYEEALSQTFGGSTPQTINTTEATFKHVLTGTDATYYWYRVRAVNTCNGGTGPFSDPIAVGILPPQQNTKVGATPVENPQNTTYQLQICIASSPNCAFVGPVGAGFTATTDQPWLTVSPTAGTLTAAGVTLNVTAATRGLGVGTNVGSVTVSFATAVQGRIGVTGNTTSTSNVSVNLVAPVANTPKNTPPPDALIIPAVAHADGQGNSHFESDIRVSNTSPQPMKYQVTFTPSGEAGIKDGKQTTIDIDPGRTVALDDVLQSWFGSGTSATGATGSLEIRPLTSSASSVSSSALSGLPNLLTFATSRTYSTLSAGSLGTYVPAIPYANFIGRSSSALTLQQIAQNTDSRTNFGLVEGSGEPATVLIKMFSSSGQPLGSMTQQLNGGQHLQINSILSRNNLNNITDGRIEVSVTSATGKVTAYASVLDNKTNDAQLVSPISLAQNGSAKYVVPGVADATTSDGKVQTDLRLFNATSSSVTATLALHVDGSPANVLTKDVTLSAGQVQTLDNVLNSLFGVSNVGNAALHITTAAPTNLIATAKTYSSSSAGTIGEFINAVTPSQSITASSRPLQLLQVEESNRFSTDVGVAEVSGKPVDLEITIIPQDSKVAAKTTISLQAGEFHTMHQLLKSVGLDAGYDARVTIKVVGGAGAATAYASTIDLATHDTTFVPAQ